MSPKRNRRHVDQSFERLYYFPSLCPTFSTAHASRYCAPVWINPTLTLFVHQGREKSEISLKVSGAAPDPLRNNLPVDLLTLRFFCLQKEIFKELQS